MLYVEETLETWEPLVSLVKETLQAAHLLLVLLIGAVEFPCVVVLHLLHIGVQPLYLPTQIFNLPMQLGILVT